MVKKLCQLNVCWNNAYRQESPAVADKPSRRESMSNTAPIRRVNKLQTTTCLN